MRSQNSRETNWQDETSEKTETLLPRVYSDEWSQLSISLSTSGEEWGLLGLYTSRDTGGGRGDEEGDIGRIDYEMK